MVSHFHHNDTEMIKNHKEKNVLKYFTFKCNHGNRSRNFICLLKLEKLHWVPQNSFLLSKTPSFFTDCSYPNYKWLKMHFVFIACVFFFEYFRGDTSGEYGVKTILLWNISYSFGPDSNYIITKIYIYIYFKRLLFKPYHTRKKSVVVVYSLADIRKTA